MEEELELIRSSLLPSETLQPDEADSSQYAITSADTPYRIHFTAIQAGEAPVFQLKSDDMGREEAVGWSRWVEEKLAESWKEALATGYPLYYMITTHFLPILQENPTKAQSDEAPKDDRRHQSAYQPGHLLFTSHHLLSPTKRRLLSSLSSSLHLKGFGKTGYPGIIFAQGDLADLAEFAREVKSWQWLALRLRVLEADQASKEDQRLARGKWEEVTKIGEALDWLRDVGKEYLLTDSGIGVSSSEGKK